MVKTVADLRVAPHRGGGEVESQEGGEEGRESTGGRGEGRRVYLAGAEVVVLEDAVGGVDGVLEDGGEVDVPEVGDPVR